MLVDWSHVTALLAQITTMRFRPRLPVEYHNDILWQYRPAVFEQTRKTIAFFNFHNPYESQKAHYENYWATSASSCKISKIVSLNLLVFMLYVSGGNKWTLSILWWWCMDIKYVMVMVHWHKVYSGDNIWSWNIQWWWYMAIKYTTVMIQGHKLYSGDNIRS